MPSVDFYVLIVAAGAGLRFKSDKPKLLCNLLGKPIIEHTIGAAFRSSTKGIVLVAQSDYIGKFTQIAKSCAQNKLLRIVVGGKERTDSVRAGLAALAEFCKADEIALIQDGARPLTSPELFDKCATAAAQYGAAISALPVTDTIKYVENDVIKSTPSRKNLWAAQTPQAFRYNIIVKALSKDAHFTDDAAAVEALGYPVHIIMGETVNIKITTPEDITIAEAIMGVRQK